MRGAPAAPRRRRPREARPATFARSQALSRRCARLLTSEPRSAGPLRTAESPYSAQPRWRWPCSPACAACAQACRLRWAAPARMQVRPGGSCAAGASAAMRSRRHRRSRKAPARAHDAARLAVTGCARRAAGRACDAGAVAVACRRADARTPCSLSCAAAAGAPPRRGAASHHADARRRQVHRGRQLEVRAPAVDMLHPAQGLPCARCDCAAAPPLAASRREGARLWAPRVPTCSIGRPGWRAALQRARLWRLGVLPATAIAPPPR